MSVYYVSNENGDWWTIDTESTTGQTLFVIKEEDLKKKAYAEGLIWADADIDFIDKLENVIREHGTAQDVEVAG
jgi:phosphorylcholine metabolism protein LicD